MARKTESKRKPNATSANLGFKAEPWAAANPLRVPAPRRFAPQRATKRILPGESNHANP